MWSMFFFLLSYLDRNPVESHFVTLDAGRGSMEVFYMLNSTFCARTANAGENYVHQVSDGFEEVRSVTDLAGNLVDCAVTSSQGEVSSFMRVCRLGIDDKKAKRGALEHNWPNVAEAKLQCQAFQKRLKQIRGTTRTPEPDTILHRSKRGFTYPGTLWCGAGNIADSYDHLGEFAETDSCCRIHDHCPYVIQAFSRNFGYTNFKWHSISHCDCDNALKTCLRKVNDTSSRVVGQAFFNVIEVPCFDFTYEEQCVERHWYGICKTFDKVPVAMMKESDPYDFGDIDVIDKLTIVPRVPKVNEDGDRLESTTPLPVSSPQSTTDDEPSIGRVVTAAEDFIKVLATVSTSQSSTTEAAKEEVQGTNRKNRKKKKKMDKKRKDSKKKGKGQKRKQRVNILSKVEEATTMTPVGHRAEDIINNSLASNPTYLRHKLDQNVNTLDYSLTHMEGKGEFSNELMKDEPQRQLENRDKNVVTAPTNVHFEPEELEFHRLQHSREKDHVTLTGPSTTVNPFQLNKQKSKETQEPGQKQKITPDPITPSFSLRITESPQKTIKCSTGTTPSSDLNIVVKRECEPQMLQSHREKELLITMSNVHQLNFIKNKKQKLKDNQRQKSRRISLSVHNHKTKKIQTTTSYISSSPNLSNFNIHNGKKAELERSDSDTKKAFVTTSAAPTVSLVKVRRQKGKRGRKGGRKITPAVHTIVASA
ncbi:hypothetical protein GN956_G8726 [Arapaima gigas]